MKHRAKVYAKTLADLMIEKKTEAQEEKIVENFLKLLEKNGDMKKAKDIVSLAENMFIKKTGRRKVLLETARRLEKKEILKSFERAGDIVQQKIDKNLIAGIKITVNDKQLDFSMRKKIQELFK